MSNWFSTILATIIALLPIINPVSTATIFMSVTGGMSKEMQKSQALKASVYTFSILLVFLITGTLIMEFFGISIPGLRIAGGVMVMRIAFSMFSSKEPDMEDDSRKEAIKKEDVSFTPLAMPSMSGPGAIAVTIGLSAGTERWTDYTAIVLGIAIVVLTAFITLRASGKVLKFFGRNGVEALSKIMGFLLLCVGIQFFINGIVDIIAGEDFLNRLLEALEQVR